MPCPEACIHLPHRKPPSQLAPFLSPSRGFLTVLTVGPSGYVFLDLYFKSCLIHSVFRWSLNSSGYQIPSEPFGDMEVNKEGIAVHQGVCAAFLAPSQPFCSESHSLLLLTFHEFIS